MKKRLFSIIGAGTAATVLSLVLVFGSQESKASQVSILNAKALSDGTGGQCTGPKNQTTSWCECTNTNPCSDTSGCNSTSDSN